LDASEIKEVQKILSKYSRKVHVIPMETFPVLDSRGRIQLKNKKQFFMENMGIGSFYKTLSEKGHIWNLKNRGVKYLYLQPLNNIKSKIIDFDLLDIMVSLNDKQSIKQKSILFSTKSNYEPKRSLTVYGRKNKLTQKIVKMYKRPGHTLVDSLNDSFEFRMSLFGEQKPLTNKRTSVFNFQNYANDFEPKEMKKESESKIDCISKIYDMEGDLSLKVHDEPTDNLNSIKFFDSEKGLNWNRLHCGESIFFLDSLIKKKVWKKFNLGRFVKIFFNFKFQKLIFWILAV
jgi:hypothetical protein